jgi:hypothetical protein
MLNFKRQAHLFRQNTLSALLVATVCGLPASNQPAYAQRAANLFTMCKFTGYAGDLTNRPMDVVIGRELFTAVGYISTQSNDSIICRVRPSNSAYKYKTLRLAFGMQDEKVWKYGCSRPVTVNVYLDGNLQESRSLLPSEAALLILPISTVSSVAIEATNSNCGNYGSVYFTQAILEPISTSPGKRY